MTNEIENNRIVLFEIRITELQTQKQLAPRCKRGGEREFNHSHTFAINERERRIHRIQIFIEIVDVFFVRLRLESNLSTDESFYKLATR